ncbi:unnamed protein product [Spirodela intermedia]|uniref:Uncharacterized protein n=1 Tax=Spirodela intermedia TaxID=51605 RepID=A0A7I8JB39_SPIIN|nr:unnamed protein product [Spirodela intermedia]CAA6667294.1 unnamed protein product [Spirodela intermedia]
MKEGYDGGAMAESPLGQHLVKMIGNVCFSFFALSVLIFTVIAVTYQPADPWFDSTKALVSRSFSQTLSNSTFQTDTSLLTTAEDQAAAAPSADATPPPPSATLLAGLNASSALLCDGGEGDPPFNCSHPGVLDAIRRSHAKNFKSLIFISYETPVAGSSPDRCEVAWWFRNRREKSWRRYRDYRWFVLTPGENCTFKVTNVGKYRSGGKAGGQNRRSKVAGGAAPILQRYLSRNSRRGGTCTTPGRGLLQGDESFPVELPLRLGEAQFLNRTFVMDLSICLSSSTNPNKKDEGKDFRLYFDFEHLKESASIVEEGEFLRDWKKWDQPSSGGKKQRRQSIAVRKVATYKVTPMQLKKDQSTILWRQFPGPEPENYWYRVCEGRAANFVHRPWQAIWKSKRLMNVVSQIAGKMDWNYDAVHVLWPNLDGDTSPDALVDKLTKVIQPRRNLYIATNEPFYHYFDKLRSHFTVHLLDDFKDLWGNQSEWYNETRELSDGRPPEFDEHMRVAVDTEVLYRAKTRVETFNNLTRDCKNGINSC